MAALIIVFSVATDYFFEYKNFMNITRQVSITLTVSIGMLIVILTGEIDLSVGSISALTGSIAALILTRTGLGLISGMITATVCGIGTGVLTGFVNGMLSIFFRMPSFIVTLSMMGICRGITQILCDGKAISGLPTEYELMGAGYLVSGMLPVSTAIALTVTALGFLLLQKTKHGMYLKAVGDNREAARLSAVPVKKYKTAGFVVCGGLASLGGLLTVSRLLSAQPTASTGMEMDVISAVILGGASLSGGRGTVIGVLLGALIIGIINNGMNLMQISSYYQMVVKGVIIIVAVLLKSKSEES